MSYSEKIMVGLSGGVDSAVAAHLLLEQGYQVEAMFMKNWEEDDDAEYCSAAQDLADAQQVANSLGIKLHTVNFSSEYWDKVFDHFLKEYQAGRTPNPDVLCNREIKFKAFLDFALHKGADRIATGHYAGISWHDDSLALIKGHDENKDQSYFLHLLDQYQLSKASFPIGDLEKPRVREIAAKLKLAPHNKKDSTGICFIGERPFRDFLQTYLPAQPGEIVDPEGKVIGSHQGLMYYTIGQRQGLGIGGHSGGSNSPWYVADKDLEHNQLLVVQGAEHPLLFKTSLTLQTPHWIRQVPDYANGYECMVKTRYRQSDQPCTLYPGKEQTIEVHFASPQRAITPGQSAVFYQGNECLGGGVIIKGYNQPGS